MGSKELSMDAISQDGKKEYTTPRWVQVWFLRRSRDTWKRRSKQLRVEAKRLQNRVNDVTRSREKWREEAEQAKEQVKELEAQNARLQEQAALKKGGRRGGGRSPSDRGAGA
jgi:hypothetical protein